MRIFSLILNIDIRILTIHMATINIAISKLCDELGDGPQRNLESHIKIAKASHKYRKTIAETSN